LPHFPHTFQDSRRVNLAGMNTRRRPTDPIAAAIRRIFDAVERAVEVGRELAIARDALDRAVEKCAPTLNLLAEERADTAEGGRDA
jgi:hypothetical protein